MKNQSSVNDIFQNENSKNNKTKTILLLTIVAMILIITFLIIAWVMARDNTIESIQLTEDNQNTKVLNQPPYGYNINENKDNNETQTTMLDPFNIGTTKMSDTPPTTIPTNIPMLSIANSSQKTNEMDNDLKMQAKLQELQQKHLEKSKSAQADKDSNKSITVAQKAPAPSPREAQLAENKANPTQEEKKAIDSKNTQNTIKPDIKPTNTQAKDAQTKGQNPSPNDKKNDDKKIDDKKAVDNRTAQRQQPTQNPANNSNKPKSDNIIEKNAQQIENNGKVATKGHYIQVGSFTGNVDKNFLNRISKYPYRIKTDDRDGKTIVKYLIGPYSSKVEANSNIQKIKEIQGNAFYTEIK